MIKIPKKFHAIKIETSLAERIREFCRKHQLKQNSFVRKALEEQLVREEALEDIGDLKTLRNEEKNAISLEEYLLRQRK